MCKDIQSSKTAKLFLETLVVLSTTNHALQMPQAKANGN